MSEDPKVIEAAWVEEGFMQPSRKRITFQCPACSHVWTRTYKAEPLNDPPCPNKHCADKRALVDLQKQVANLTAMLESGQAPAQIGNNVKVQAIDTTAKIVMEDNNMTNLRDGIRQGETMAPKLPAPMQNAANNFFSGGAAALGSGQNMTRSQKRMQMLGKQVLNASAPMPMSIAPNQVLPNKKPSDWVRTVAAYGGKQN